jgi:hypothetical protein
MKTSQLIVIGFALTGLAAMGLGTAACKKGGAGGDGGGAGVAPGTLTILHTNNNDGEIEPCG